MVCSHWFGDQDPQPPSGTTRRPSRLRRVHVPISRPFTARNPAQARGGGGRGLGATAGASVHISYLRRAGSVLVLNLQNTLKPLKPRLQHLPQGSHPRPRAASAPFVYGSDVRGWSLGAQPGASPLPAAPAPHASPLGNRIASLGLPSAMPPAGVARRTHSWVFLEILWPKSRGRQGGGGGTLSGSCPAPRRVSALTHYNSQHALW